MQVVLRGNQSDIVEPQLSKLNNSANSRNVYRYYMIHCFHASFRV